MQEIWYFQAVEYVIVGKYGSHGHFVGFCRRVGTLWSEYYQNSANQLNNANETYQF